jgi:MFS family permease
MSAPPAPARPPRLSAFHAWYAVAVLTLANVSGFVDRQILALLVTPIQRDLKVTDTELGVLAGLGFAVFYSLLGVPIGRWVDGGGHRPRIVALGAAVWSLLTACTAGARSYAQLFLLRIGVGVGEATLSPAAVSIIADAFPSERRGIAMSTYMVGTFAGSGIGYALGAYVVGRLDTPGMLTVPLLGSIYPWQVVFLLVGLPGLLVALLALTMREPRMAATAPRPAGAASLGAVWQHVRTHGRTMASLSLGYACSASVNYGIAFWLATFLMRTHGWSVEQAGTLQGVLTFTVGPVGVLLGGRLSDAWTRRGRLDAPLRVGMLAALGMLVCAGSYPVVPSATVAATLLVPVNLFAAMPWGAANAAVAEAMPSTLRGQGSALYQLVQNLVSGAVGPAAVALLTDQLFGDPGAVRWSLAVVAVVGMTATLLLLGWGRSAYQRTVAAVRAAEGAA